METLCRYLCPTIRDQSRHQSFFAPDHGPTDPSDIAEFAGQLDITVHSFLESLSWLHVIFSTEPDEVQNVLRKVKNDLANRLEAITWNEGNNTISIIKKIQIIIMETVQESWNDRCRLKAKIMSDEERKLRYQKRNELLQKITIKNTQNKNSQKEANTSRKMFSSEPQTEAPTNSDTVCYWKVRL